MSFILSDAEIAAAILDRKGITRSQLRSLKDPKRLTARGDLARQISILGRSRRHYFITARRNVNRPLGFSVILSSVWHGKRLNIIRCNGQQKGHHTNWLEKRAGAGVRAIPPYTFHVHQLTERYQPERPEHYAEPTNDYSSFESAVEYLCSNYGIVLDKDGYETLYPLFGNL